MKNFQIETFWNAANELSHRSSGGGGGFHDHAQFKHLHILEVTKFIFWSV